MKKLMMLALGLGVVLGTVSFAAPTQDKMDKTDKMEKKSKKKKKADKTDKM